MLLLLFMLFQTRDDARQLLTLIDARLGVPLPERDYGSHCELYTPGDPVSSFRNIHDAIKDEFFLSHILGWWGHTIVFRSVPIAFFCSVFFEIVELSLQHILPNFYECWWDHLILDLLLCNCTGLFLGWVTLQLLQMKQYNWSGFFTWSASNAPTKKQSKFLSFPRSIFAFIEDKIRPDFDRFTWKIFSSWKRCLYVVYLIVNDQVISTTPFFIKSILWIPPVHPINLIRLFIIFFISCPGTREYYQFKVDPSVHVLGANAWIFMAVVLLELLCVFKWTLAAPPSSYPPFLHEPWPAAVVWPWFIGVISLLVLYIWFFFIRSKKDTKNKSK